MEGPGTGRITGTGRATPLGKRSCGIEALGRGPHGLGAEPIDDPQRRHRSAKYHTVSKPSADGAPGGREARGHGALGGRSARTGRAEHALQPLAAARISAL